MIDTPMPDWVLVEAAKRAGYHWLNHTVEDLREYYAYGENDDLFSALCDMILKHEQSPVDRKLLCAREAASLWDIIGEADKFEDACLRAIELWEEGFGK